ncbi:MAG: response regulator [Deltaproteobacteria bacterium]|nr:response regulator [Deltaproteobacteria bacterium]
MTADKSARGKILVVDNDASVAMLMSALLETSGYGVICADSNIGLNVARKERPILIFLDGSASQRSGASLYRELRCDPELQRVPVVMLFDSPPPPRRSGSPQKRLPPPDACVTRPFAPYLLLATVDHLLRARLSIN